MRTVKQWKRQCETEIARRGLRFHDMGHGWTAEPLGLDSRQGWRAAESAELPEELRHFVAEINGRRDIACNPADLRGETDFFPHITANVETRNEACFCARNAINGLHCNNYHGEWPFGSWGIGAREDAWCCIDFGREVMVDAMALILRADFPHDAYWVSGHVVLSDGAEVAFDLQKTGERQIIPLGKHTVRWMRLERMQKSDDPSAFPALTEWEVCGCDKEGE